MVLTRNIPAPFSISFTFNNRPMVEHYGFGYCTHCAVVFRVEWVREWVDRFIPRKGAARKDYGVGQTALCPCCGIDYVTPYAPVVQIGGVFL